MRVRDASDVADATRLATKGQPFFNASGDYDAYAVNPLPCDSPYIMITRQGNVSEALLQNELREKIEQASVHRWPTRAANSRRSSTPS